MTPGPPPGPTPPAATACTGPCGPTCPGRPPTGAAGSRTRSVVPGPSAHQCRRSDRVGSGYPGASWVDDGRTFSRLRSLRARSWHSRQWGCPRDRLDPFVGTWARRTVRLTWNVYRCLSFMDVHRPPAPGLGWCRVWRHRVADGVGVRPLGSSTVDEAVAGERRAGGPRVGTPDIILREVPAEKSRDLRRLDPPGLKTPTVEPRLRGPG